MITRFTAGHDYPVPLETLWGFFSDPRNLPRITPGARIEPADAVMRLGGEIIVHGELAGMHGSVTLRYERVDPPNEFVDVLTRSPLRSWRQSHRFRAIDERTSHMDDEITYELHWYQRPFANALYAGLVKEHERRYHRVLGILGVDVPTVQNP